MSIRCGASRTKAVPDQRTAVGRMAALQPGQSADAQGITEAHRFTPKEKAVFALLLRDKGDAAIAQELQISEAAARSEYRKIIKKLGVSGRHEIAQRAREWDLAVSRLLQRFEGVLLTAAACQVLVV